RLELVVGDRPVRQRGARDVADDAVEAEGVFGEPGAPPLPMTRPAADHLRHGAEELLAGLLLAVGTHRPRVQQRIRPEVVAVDVGQLVAAERLAGTPRATLE